MLNEKELSATNGSLITLKAELLSHGVLPTEEFLDAYGPPFLEKRRAYGNADDLTFRQRLVPQEMILLPERLICAVNIRATSPWRLDYKNGAFVVRREELEFQITFPLHPRFYDVVMSTNKAVRSVITLYGGGALGVFAYGTCALVQMDKACQYCSISPNRQQQTEFPHVVTPELLREGLSIALQDRACPIKQVMINGGNFSDPDKSFLYYVGLVTVAREVLNSSGRKGVDLHLIVYPPNDLSLLTLLKDLDVSVAMNLEVFEPNLFKRFCPGKHVVSGQPHIMDALLKAAEVLGMGRVFSIFVGGLEPQETMDVGLHFFGDRGVVPVINVFHADPDTPLHHHPMPSAERIVAMGSSLQSVYQQMDKFEPFYLDCGRNSLDTEAYRGLF